MGFCKFSMFCCTFICVNSSVVIILMGKRELVALLSLSSWYPVIVAWLFLTMPRVSLQFVIVVFPDHLLSFGNGADSPDHLLLAYTKDGVEDIGQNLDI